MNLTVTVVGIDYDKITVIYANREGKLDQLTIPITVLKSHIPNYEPHLEDWFIISNIHDDLDIRPLLIHN